MRGDKKALEGMRGRKCEVRNKKKEARGQKREGMRGLRRQRGRIRLRGCTLDRLEIVRPDFSGGEHLVV